MSRPIYVLPRRSRASRWQARRPSRFSAFGCTVAIAVTLALLALVLGLHAETRGASWQTAVASWYGGSDGLLGNKTRCGPILTTSLLGVAHRSLPCWTRVTFRHAGHVITVPVVDRGPFVEGRMWDLTVATCRALDHCWTGPIEYQVGGRVTAPPAPVQAAPRPLRGAALPATDTE